MRAPKLNSPHSVSNSYFSVFQKKKRGRESSLYLLLFTNLEFDSLPFCFGVQVSLEGGDPGPSLEDINIISMSFLSSPVRLNILIVKSATVF